MPQQLWGEHRAPAEPNDSGRLHALLDRPIRRLELWPLLLLHCGGQAYPRVAAPVYGLRGQAGSSSSVRIEARSRKAFGAASVVSLRGKCPSLGGRSPQVCLSCAVVERYVASGEFVVFFSQEPRRSRRPNRIAPSPRIEAKSGYIFPALCVLHPLFELRIPLFQKRQPHEAVKRVDGSQLGGAGRI
mgnify:FL=1